MVASGSMVGPAFVVCNAVRHYQKRFLKRFTIIAPLKIQSKIDHFRRAYLGRPLIRPHIYYVYVYTFVYRDTSKIWYLILGQVFDQHLQ